jgi:hypothetical protein
MSDNVTFHKIEKTNYLWNDKKIICKNVKTIKYVPILFIYN